jgi:TetR/AcrR family transcriptional regulator
MVARHADKSSPRALKAPAQRQTEAPRRPGRPSGSVSGPEQRNRLLDTALALFAKQGIVDTSLSDIAREAGVTPAMLHYYFKTRDQLLDVLIDERIQPRRAAIGEMFDVNEGDPVTVITRLTEKMMQVATEHAWFPSLWMREVLSDNGVLRQRIVKRHGKLHFQNAVACIARWQSEGKLNPDLEPSLVFMSILGLTVMPLIAIKSWPADPTRAKLTSSDIARHALTLLTHGVGPKR